MYTEFGTNKWKGRYFYQTEYIDEETGEIVEKIKGDYWFKELRQETERHETKYNTTIITRKYGRLYRKPTQQKLF